MNLEEIVFLEGERVKLRALEELDLNENYLQWLNDIEVCEFNSHATFPNNIWNMRKYFDSLSGDSAKVVLGVFLKENNTHIGNISLQNIDWVSRNAEFAILMGEKKNWGKGLAFEAAQLVIEYGFKRLNLHRIYCGTSDLNIGMQKLAAKLGMCMEGRRKEAMYKNGRYVDILEYGILNKP